MFLIDTHCHIHTLNYKKLHKNIKSVLNNAFNKNVKMFLAVSTSVQDFKNLKYFTKGQKNIFLSCGLHPIYKHKKSDILDLENLSRQHIVIAIGETGLDFYRSLQKKREQIKLFEKHIYISKKLKKPIIIHSRCAKKETISALYSCHIKETSGILHSFNEDIDMARKILDLGFYISFSGIITFKNADYLRKVLNFIPINRLLIETDSPYLSPEPVRNQENQPSYLFYIAKYISNYIKMDFLILFLFYKKIFLHYLN
ncbi:putative deoxyribonuclease [Buchnera aphidicola (Cinara tujafilina)]|uniref:Putative deoxyribonuclease n=1 Tax=Buchnera aphidicola (Cinara tujafilina) TaxID=261317 RepID=F7WZF2_9GAMM|nr:YchF/TatD family DNA exonuclease [Buchnera aphidicola]AEH39814.1 putative deoxyribonuclease [Buchnera aphidicola (Cinara tujafilina)]